MATFAAVVSTILTDLNRGSSYQTRVKKAVEDAIKFYRSRRFTFNTKRAEASLTSSAEFVILPTDFIEVDYLRIKDGSDLDKLEEVTYHWIVENRVNTDYTSRPEKFSIQNKELRLWPPSDSSYTLTISYIYDLAGVSASASDEATNAWTDEAEELIRLHAMADVLEHSIRGPEAIQEAHALRAGKIRDVYNQLKRRANRQESTGRIMPWC